MSQNEEKKEKRERARERDRVWWWSREDVLKRASDFTCMCLVM